MTNCFSLFNAKIVDLNSVESELNASVFCERATCARLQEYGTISLKEEKDEDK